MEAGLAHKVRLSGRRFLYEHLHTGQRHDHLACRRCGRMVEFVSAGITALLGEICRAHGFDGKQNQLQILGLCRDCAGKRRRRRSPARERTCLSPTRGAVRRGCRPS